jgi:hypothetical protein
MKSNINETPLKRYNQIPKSWYLLPHFLNYDKRTSQQHYDEGWRDFVEPEFDSETHKKTGELVFNQGYDKVTYKVEPLTELEIEQRAEIARLNIVNQALEARRVRIEAEAEKIVTAPFQELEDEEELLANQDIFPIWENLEEGYSFILDAKYQALEEGEMKLYKVLQAHNKQSDWHPTIVPALFVKVLIPTDTTPEWEAGIAVTVGEEYTYLGITYIVVQSHTTQLGWEPPNIPSLWSVKP